MTGTAQAQEGPPVTRHKGSMDKPCFVIKINVKLAYLQAIFIHPENNTYPIFSIIVQ